MYKKDNIDNPVISLKNYKFCNRLRSLLRNAALSDGLIPTGSRNTFAFSAYALGSYDGTLGRSSQFWDVSNSKEVFAV